MRSIIYLLFIYFSSFSSYSQSPEWVNYVNDYFIYDIALEEDYIWAGTGGGLVRFDRESEIRSIYLPDNSGLKGFGVKVIHIAKDGTKWIGSEAGGMSKLNGTQWQNFNKSNDGKSLTDIFSIKSAPNGDIWFMDSQSEACAGCYELFRLSNNLILNTDSVFNPQNLQTEAVNSFDIAPSGDVWFISDHSIKKYDGQSIIQAFNAAAFPLEEDERFERILAKDSNDIIVATLKYGGNAPNKFRILRYDGTDWSFMDFSTSPFTPGNPNHLFLDENGNVWYQYANDPYTQKFYAKHDGSTWQKWSVNDFPSLPPIYNDPDLLMVDERGWMWFSGFTHGGIHAPKLFKLKGAALVAYDTEIYPLLLNRVTDITFDCDETAWLLSDDGFNLFDGQDWEDYTNTEIGLSLSPFSILNDPADCKQWITSYGGPVQNGLISIDNGIVTAHGGGAYLADLTLDKHGNIWVTAPSKGIGRFNGTNWKWYNELNSPVTDYASHIAADLWGGIWASTLWNGLVHFNGEDWIVFNESNSPISNHAGIIYADKKGYIWTSVEGGLLRYNGLDWDHFPISDSPYHPTCIVQDQFGNYWVGTLEGAYYMKGKNSLIHYHIHNSDIGWNGVWKIRIDTYNNKWFAHGNGVSVFNEKGISNLTNKISNQKFNVTTERLRTVTDSTGRPSKFTIFPNPTKGDFTAERASHEFPDNATWQLSIFDAAGKKYFSEKKQGRQAKISNLQPGFYFVVFEIEGKRVSRKLVVMGN